MALKLRGSVISFVVMGMAGSGVTFGQGKLRCDQVFDSAYGSAWITAPRGSCRDDSLADLPPAEDSASPSDRQSEFDNDPAASDRPSSPFDPETNLSMASPTAGTSSPTTAATSPQSSAPNMIGDTQAGSCGALTFGGEVGAVVAHPTFACSRLNIAEQNSPLVRDRGFFSYRHFQNASEVNIFGDQPAGGASNLNIDRYIFGFEKRIFGNSSIEFRLPLTYQLDSDLSFSKLTGMPSTLPLSDRTEDIGNLSLVFKQMVHQSDSLVLSGGVGVNIPTASDVTLSGRIDDDFFPVTDNMGMPDTFDIDMTFRGVVRNETVNLSPFIASLWTPTPRFFAQGFLQVDVPLNGSNAVLVMDGSIDGDSTLIPTTNESGDLTQQILMRINAGMGYWFYRNRCAACVTGVSGLLEIHHTTTLDSADTLGPFVVIPAPTMDFQDTVLQVGNLANRNDITNLVIGATVELGQLTSVTNGFVLPLSTGDNRGFDFEYNFFIQHLF